MPPEALPAPAVQSGPGLLTGIPLPLPPGIETQWERRHRCNCCADSIPVLKHAEYCPQYTAPVVRVTGCDLCGTTTDPHFHAGHVLYEAGRELF